LQEQLVESTFSCHFSSAARRVLDEGTLLPWHQSNITDLAELVKVIPGNILKLNIYAITKKLNKI